MGEASDAIDVGRAVVEEQTSKFYEFNITEEDALKQAVQEARKALHDDLTSVRDEVKAARDAVHDAATTLAQITKVDEFEVEESESDENPELEDSETDEQEQ